MMLRTVAYRGHSHLSCTSQLPVLLHQIRKKGSQPSKGKAKASTQSHAANKSWSSTVNVPQTKLRLRPKDRERTEMEEMLQKVNSIEDLCVACCFLVHS